ncbi:MAG: hypothetical protein K6T17_00480 [Fimbriimonadales bacterium]|nr:hypothetical protein [Fimbriimonadales bacterium]
MPKCSVCGNEIPHLPSWLDQVHVKFRCSKCAGSAPFPATSALGLARIESFAEQVPVIPEELDIEAVDAEVISTVELMEAEESAARAEEEVLLPPDILDEEEAEEEEITPYEPTVWACATCGYITEALPKNRKCPQCGETKWEKHVEDVDVEPLDLIDEEE